MDGVQVEDLSGVGVPTIIVKGPGGLLIVLTHPLPPIGRAYAAARDTQLRRLTELLQEAGGRYLLLGDLNATPWSHAFPVAVPGHVPRGTWPAALPLRLPIDHVLTGERVELKSRRVGPDIGSDHLPVIAVVRLPE